MVEFFASEVFSNLWHYIKGLLIGFFLLWLILFVSFTISDGFMQTAIFSVTLFKALLGMFQKATGGTGIWIVLFIILSSWIWSFGQKQRPRASGTGSDSNRTPQTPLEQPEQSTEKSES